MKSLREIDRDHAIEPSETDDDAALTLLAEQQAEAWQSSGGEHQADDEGAPLMLRLLILDV